MNAGDMTLVANAVARHGGDEWYRGLVHAALEETGGHVSNALALAEAAWGADWDTLLSNEFVPEQHPRDKGKFTSGGGSGAAPAQDAGQGAPQGGGGGSAGQPSGGGGLLGALKAIGKAPGAMRDLALKVRVKAEQALSDACDMVAPKGQGGALKNIVLATAHSYAQKAVFGITHASATGVVGNSYARLATFALSHAVVGVKQRIRTLLGAGPKPTKNSWKGWQVVYNAAGDPVGAIPPAQGQQGQQGGDEHAPDIEVMVKATMAAIKGLEGVLGHPIPVDETELRQHLQEQMDNPDQAGEMDDLESGGDGQGQPADGNQGADDGSIDPGSDLETLPDRVGDDSEDTAGGDGSDDSVDSRPDQGAGQIQQAPAPQADDPTNPALTDAHLKRLHAVARGGDDPATNANPEGYNQYKHAMAMTKAAEEASERAGGYNLAGIEEPDPEYPVLHHHDAASISHFRKMDDARSAGDRDAAKLHEKAMELHGEASRAHELAIATMLRESHVKEPDHVPEDPHEASLDAADASAHAAEVDYSRDAEQALEHARQAALHAGSEDTAGAVGYHEQAILSHIEGATYDQTPKVVEAHSDAIKAHKAAIASHAATLNYNPEGYNQYKHAQGLGRAADKLSDALELKDEESGDRPRPYGDLNEVQGGRGMGEGEHAYHSRMAGWHGSRRSHYAWVASYEKSHAGGEDTPESERYGRLAEGHAHAANAHADARDAFADAMEKTKDEGAHLPVEHVPEDPHEASLDAADATAHALDEGGRWRKGSDEAEEAARQAVVHAAGDDPAGAVKYHSEAADFHDGAAARATRVMEDPVIARLHRDASQAHRAAIASHSATLNANPEGHNQYTDAMNLGHKAEALSKALGGHGGSGTTPSRYHANAANWHEMEMQRIDDEHSDRDPSEGLPNAASTEYNHHRIARDAHLEASRAFVHAADAARAEGRVNPPKLDVILDDPHEASQMAEEATKKATSMVGYHVNGGTAVFHSEDATTAARPDVAKDAIPHHRMAVDDLKRVILDVYRDKDVRPLRDAIQAHETAILSHRDKLDALKRDDVPPDPHEAAIEAAEATQRAVNSDSHPAMLASMNAVHTGGNEEPRDAIHDHAEALGHLEKMSQTDPKVVEAVEAHKAAMRSHAATLNAMSPEQERDALGRFASHFEEGLDKSRKAVVAFAPPFQAHHFHSLSGYHRAALDFLGGEGVSTPLGGHHASENPVILSYRLGNDRETGERITPEQAADEHRRALSHWETPVPGRNEEHPFGAHSASEEALQASEGTSEPYERQSRFAHQRAVQHAQNAVRGSKSEDQADAVTEHGGAADSHLMAAFSMHEGTAQRAGQVRAAVHHAAAIRAHAATLNQVQRDGLLTNSSYFAGCDRDELGRCLPDDAPGERSDAHKIFKRMYKEAGLKGKLELKVGVAADLLTKGLMDSSKMLGSKVVGALTATGSALLRPLKGPAKAFFNSLPAPVQTACKFAGGLAAKGGMQLVEDARGLEHRLDANYTYWQDLAKQVARDRGIPEEHVQRAARSAAAEDMIARWGPAIPLVHAGMEASMHGAVEALAQGAGDRGGTVHALAHVGMITASKAGFYLPWNSMLHVGLHMAEHLAGGKNPIRLIRRASAKVRAAQALHEAAKLGGPGVGAGPTTHGSMSTNAEGKGAMANNDATTDVLGRPAGSNGKAGGQRSGRAKGMSRADYLAEMAERLDALGSDEDRDEYEMLAAAASDYLAGEEPADRYRDVLDLADRAFAKRAHQEVANALRVQNQEDGEGEEEDEGDVGGGGDEEATENYSVDQLRDLRGRWVSSNHPDAAVYRAAQNHRLASVTRIPRGCKEYKPDVEKDANGDGVSDAARVGVPAMKLPPPPRIPRLPNLTGRERAAESSFANAFEKRPVKMTADFRNECLAKALRKGGPPEFGTDDAKGLAKEWSADDPVERATNRSTLNIALHQTANAIAKRAFLQHLNTLKPGDEVMVTNGGCGAGKGYALGPKGPVEAQEAKASAKAVWDSAGDQNATENPWIQHECAKRGLKTTYAYVHVDPYSQWADPGKGVVARAGKPEDGRMVDAKVFADSYAIGAKNFNAFYKHHKGNPDVKFLFLDNSKATPSKLPGFPKEDLHIDRHDLAEYATVRALGGDAPGRVKLGACGHVRIWPDKDS